MAPLEEVPVSRGWPLSWMGGETGATGEVIPTVLKTLVGMVVNSETVVASVAWKAPVVVVVAGPIT